MDTNRRSVLLIIADDWSPIAGCYGDSVIRTPCIDAVARRGITFDHAYCTSPSCAASRANLLTGLYTHTHGQYGHSHGVHGFRTHEHVKSLPGVLREAGVRSGCIGKTHFAPGSVYPFDVMEASESMSARQLGRSTAKFLESVGEGPFYLHVAPTFPHRHGTGFGAEVHAEEYAPLPGYDPGAMPVPGWLPDVAEVRRDLAGYYQAVSRFDACVGAVIEALRASGKAEQTLVVVMSDHGMPFPGAKASSFEGGHHCPLIVARPGEQRAGGRCAAMVNWSDIMPTVLEWMGVGKDRWPRELTGRSILGAMGEENPAGWDETYYAHCFHEVTNYYPYRVLRGRRWKFVQHLAWESAVPMAADLFRSPTWRAVLEGKMEMMGGRPTGRVQRRDREELIDLEADPLEVRNLVEDPACREIAEAMRRKLVEFRIATRDPWLEGDYQRGEIGEGDLRRGVRG